MHPRTEVIQSGKVRNLDVTESLTYQGTAFVPSAATDEKAKVSLNDTTAGYLNGKLVAGTNVTLTENNNGGDETLTISATVPVTSVNGLTGPVTLTAANVGAAATSHTHDASAIITGTIATARLATGTADSTTYLRGDQTWQTIAAGVTGFTGSQNISSPNDTRNASRLLAIASTTNADIVLQPKGNGSFLAQLPDGTTTGGNKRGAYAVDFQTVRSVNDQVASGNYSAIIGGYDHKVTNNGIVAGGSNNVCSGSSSGLFSAQNSTNSGAQSVILGGVSNNISAGQGAMILGTNSTVSSNYSVAAGSSASISSGTFSICISGNACSTTAQYATVVGGQSNAAQGTYSFIGGGRINTAVGSYSVILGGQANTAQGTRSICIGNYSNATTNGMMAFTNRAFAVSGDCQLQEYVLGIYTSDNLQTALNTEDMNAATTTSNTMTIPTDTVFGFDILATARRTDADNESAAWMIRGCIDNNAGTTAFVGTPTVTTIGDDSAGAWQITVTADDANDRLQILVTGQAGKTIRWAAHARVMRVTG